MADELPQPLWQIERAASDVRRGVPVLLTGPAPLALLAADAAGPIGLAELVRFGGEPLVLVLTPMRAAAVLRRPTDPSAPAVALLLPRAVRGEAIVRGLANPAAQQPRDAERLQPAELPELAGAALTLAVLAGLRPAVLLAPPRDPLRDPYRDTRRNPSGGELQQRHVMSVAAADVMVHPGAEWACPPRITAAPEQLDAKRVVDWGTDEEDDRYDWSGG